MPAGAEPIDVRAADQATPGSEGQRPHHVLAAADAAVEHHLDVRADRIGDGRQHGDRGRRAIELPAAVIRDHERGSAKSAHDPGILDVKDALDDQLAGPDAADPLHILPVQGLVELGLDPLRQRRDPLNALDPARQVAEGPAPGGEHA